jgi:DNA-binding NarL/FixJ family response regulator
VLGVMIVDDHPIVREGLRGMLAGEAGIEVVGEAGSGDEAVVVAPVVRPDVILMDLRMPGGDGLSAIERLAGAYTIIVLTTYEGQVDVVRALAAGAVGYLLKDVSPAGLAAAVREAARGGRVLSPAAAECLAAPPQPPPAGLSAREREVLELVAEGLTNAEIGRRLFIGEATVKTHLVRVFGKLGVSDRTAAVLAAMESGLVRRRGDGQ